MEELEPLPPATPGCPGCAARDRRIAKLEATVEELRATVKRLEAIIELQERRIRDLEERVRQNSRNSSRPPSSDPPGTPPKPPKPPSGRKPGGQPGHEGKNRGFLPIEEVKEVIHHRPAACEKCGKLFAKAMDPLDPPPLRHQVWELLLKLAEVVEHQAHARHCSCGHTTRAAFPPEVAGSSFGPRLTAAVAFLTGVCHMSRRQAEEVFEDLLGVPIGLGTVSNLEAETAQALELPYQEAAEAVQAAPVKNLDETGWKQCGKRRWLWTAATAAVAFFSIHELRGEAGLLKLLGGKLLGIFTSDRWSAYRSRPNRFRQICLAHILRDFQKLIDRGGREGKIGEKAKEIASWIFPAWKDFKAGGIDRETLQWCLRPVRRDLKQVLEEGAQLVGTKAAIFCQNLLDIEPALWTFTRVDGVEPTNNHAERVLRRGVLWRKNCFGCASDRGARFAERILTVAQSLRLQKRRVLDFLVKSVEAHRRGTPTPSILPA